MTPTKRLHTILLLTVTLTVTLGWLYQHASETLCYSKLAFVYVDNLLFWAIAIVPVRDSFKAQLEKRSLQQSLVIVGLSTLTLNQLFVYLFVEGSFAVLYTCDANISLSNWMLTNGVLSNLITFTIIIGTFYNQIRMPPTTDSNAGRTDAFQIKQNGVTHLISFNEIIKLEADNNSVNIHTEHKRYVQYGRLKDWENDLKDLGFVRIHRSYIINQRFIQAFQAKPSGDGILTLHNGDKLRVSRSYRMNVYHAGQLNLV